ncbi:hypothetical protein GCM10023094_08540 [Rhodococcus olei]|uniref:Uncharacterized protein n=1 Tax=Rhodococcus olei TaxID=2161675 RepID=A0ABP8NUM4_9NOCA
MHGSGNTNAVKYTTPSRRASGDGCRPNVPGGGPRDLPPGGGRVPDVIDPDVAPDNRRAGVPVAEDGDPRRVPRIRCRTR